MRRMLFAALALAGCGAGPDLREVKGTLAPEQVEPFLARLAERSEAIDAAEAREIAADILAMGPNSENSKRRSLTRNDKTIAVVELDVRRGISPALSVRLKANRDATDAVAPLLSD